MPQTTTPTEDQRLTNYEISTIRCLMSMYPTGTWSWEEALVVKAAMVIPEQSDQIAHRKRHGSKGGRPPAFDTADYKGRNVIERGFNNTRQWRGLATRCDKLAIVYRGAAILRAIALWLPYLSDTP